MKNRIRNLVNPWAFTTNSDATWTIRHFRRYRTLREEHQANLLAEFSAHTLGKTGSLDQRTRRLERRKAHPGIALAWDLLHCHAETLSFLADRCVETFVRSSTPHWDRGCLVLCERYCDSTLGISVVGQEHLPHMDRKPVFCEWFPKSKSHVVDRCSGGEGLGKTNRARECGSYRIRSTLTFLHSVR
jgi:hypothetical protein